MLKEEFFDDTVLQLKKVLNISPDYKTDVLIGRTAVNFVEEIRKVFKGEIKEIKESFSTCYFGVGKLERQDTFNTLVHKDFFIVQKVISNDIGELTEFSFIFSKNPDVLFNKFSKKDVSKYMNGVYEIKSGFGGEYLSKVTVANAQKPILNDDLFGELFREIHLFKKSEKTYKQLGLDYKRGILMYGSPGVGKTATIKFILSKIKALSVICDIQNTRQVLFISDLVKKEKDCLKIIIFEDIDGMDNYLRSQVLNLMDGVTQSHNVIFIATTNYPNQVDSAFVIRPGRFDNFCHVDLPNSNSRERIIKMFFGSLKENQLEELNRTVKESKGVTGSHIKEMFITSKLYNLSLYESFKRVKRKLTTLQEFDSKLYG